MSPTATSVSPAELTDLVLQALEGASHPLTFFQLQRRLPRSFQGRVDEIRQCLHELASQGRIHEFAPYRSKAPRFWTQPPEQHARLVLVEVLGEQAVTPRELFSKLRRRLQGVPDERLRELLAEMLVNGQVRKLPPRLGGRDNLLSVREPQARDYLEPVFRTLFDTLSEACKRLESEGIDRETFVREAEALWRAMPWDQLAEMPQPEQTAPEQTEMMRQPEQSAPEQTEMPQRAEPPAVVDPVPPPGQEGHGTPEAVTE